MALAPWQTPAPAPSTETAPWETSAPTTPAIHDPSDTAEMGGDDSPEAQTAAAQATIAMGTSAAGQTAAAVPYAVRSAVHGVMAGIGYAVGGDPSKVTNWLAQKHAEDRQNFDDISDFFTYHPTDPNANAALQNVGQGMQAATQAAVTGGLSLASGPADTALFLAGVPNPGIENTAQAAEDIGGDLMRVAPAAGLLKAVPGAIGAGVRAAGRLGRYVAGGPDVAVPAEAGAAAAPSAAATRGVTGDQLRATPAPIPPPQTGEPVDPATAAVQKPHLRPRAGESAQAAAARQDVTQAAAQESGQPQAAASPETPQPGASPQAPQRGPARLFSPPQFDVQLDEGTAAQPAAAASPEAPQAAASASPEMPQSAAAASPLAVPRRQRGSVRLFYPPQEDGPQFAVQTDEGTAAQREGQLQALNALAGGVMENSREGAVSGDWEQTGNEHQTAKMPGAPGQLMRDQIGSENQALNNAMQTTADQVGSVARNDVDRDTLEQRGNIVRGAVQAVDRWFSGAANGLYSTARDLMGGRAMAPPSTVLSILNDTSRDVNPTAAALRRAATAKIQQLWSVGDTRNGIHTAPGTVGAAERFHEFLNGAYHNDSADLIKELKNAMHLDVARAAGGRNLFETARAMIAHREQMLEPDGVNQLRAPKDRNKIDNEVPLHEVMDHVVNLDSEHFQHFMNVLHTGAHLGHGELADQMAAAIREIQGHMIARMHTAARGEGGAWKAADFYKTANRFSTNMPAAFAHNPELFQNLQTINRAGNVLKMDKAYPGAIAQAAKTGVLPSLLQKTVKGGKLLTTVGGAHVGGPIGAGLGHIASSAVEHGAGKLVEGRQMAAVRRSLSPLERGSVQIMNNASDESAASQEAQNWVAERAGNGIRRYRLDSDGHPTILPGIEARDPRSIPGNPVVDVDKRGQVTPVDRGGMPGNQLSGLIERSKALHGLQKQRGSVQVTRGSNPYDTAEPRRDIWTGVRPTNNRMPATETRTGNPYDSGGGRPLGAQVFGGKQRGSVSVLNVGHNVGDPANGGRVLEPEDIANAVAKVGGQITSHNVLQPGDNKSPNLFEPTSVVGLKKPLSDKQGVALARSLGQKAIPQNTATGKGDMFVPPEHAAEAKAEGWDKYNSDYFHLADGRNETSHVADLAAARAHMTPAEQAQVAKYRQSAVDKVVKAFHGSTPTDETAAMALAGKAKKGWYAGSAKALVQMFGADAPRFGALLAAMSPQIGIEGNFTNALKTWVNWDKAGRPTDPDAIRGIMENSVQRSPDAPPGKSSVLPAWHQNSVRALASANPEHESFQLSGPKVDSFMKNLRDNVHEVTNDSWNALAMHVDKALFGGQRVLAPKDIYGEVAGKSPAYIGVSAKIRAAAKTLSNMTGESWSPREVQETVWSFVKTAFEHSEKSGKSIPDLIKSGELNDELIGATPDFHRLFSSGETRGFLKGTRYEANAERLAQQPGGKPAPAAASAEALAAAQHSLAPHLEKVSKRLQGQLESRGVKPTVTDENEVPF